MMPCSIRYAWLYQISLFFSTAFGVAISIPSNNPSNLTVLHYHHAATRNLHARGVSPPRLMDSCPPPFIFAFSACASSVSQQAVGILCSDKPGGPPVKLQHDACREREEFCIEDISPGVENDRRAYCVSSNAFSSIDFASRQQPNLLTADTSFQLPVPGSGGEPVRLSTAQARLVGRFTPTRLQADFLALVSYREEDVLGKKVDRFTGGDDCRDCIAASMRPVPLGTTVLKAKVIAGPEIGNLGGAYLYIITVEAQED